MASTFQPDEAITGIRVQLHTANRSGASTDSDVFIELFDPPQGWPEATFRVELDTAGHDDFEAGETDWYELPAWYFSGRIVNDIVRICVHKGDGWGSDWCFGWLALWVNGRNLYTSPNMNTSPDQGVWLTDGTSYCEDSFVRIPFTQPILAQDGLPDAGANENYSVSLDAVGGRKPIRWLFTGAGNAFASGPTLTAVANTNGASAVFAGRTAGAAGAADWSGSIILMDVDDRTSVIPVSMRAILKLPPPTIKGFSPTFGWPGLSPAAPDAIVVTLESAGQDFDSRSNSFTRVFFSRAGGGTVEAKVLQRTSSKVHALVPNGAVTGPLTVQTPFGKSSSSGTFTVHPNGYRFVNGFSFTNVNEDKVPGSGFPTEFAWQRFEETFGMDEMWLVAFDQAIVPNPIAACFYSLAHFTAGSGCCHGFCLTSLQLAHGLLPSTAFGKDFNGYPLADSLWNFTGPAGAPDGLSHYVQDRQLVVYSDEGMSYFLDRIDSIGVVSGDPCEMDARTALDDLRHAAAGNLADPRMLAFARRCWPWEGHVVVPYQVEEGGAKSFLHVYNPNQPAQPTNPLAADTQVSIRTQDGDWGFQWDPNTLWRGLYIFTIPLSQYGHQNDWSIPGLGTLLATVGTFILGCAGAGSSGDITQVRDDVGHMLFNPRTGALIPDRTRWPQGVRPAPQFGVTDTDHHIFAVTNQASATFTVRAKPGAGAPAALHIVIGSDLAFSVEDVNVPHEIHFDAAASALRVAPVAGTASPILRLTQRRRGTSESIAYAVRARDTAAGAPLEFARSADGAGAVVRAGGAARSLDVEITHTSRIGQVRIFESDGIALPANSITAFHITSPDELDQAGKVPLVLDVDADGTGRSVSRRTVGSKLDGLVVVAPPRVIAPAPAAAAGPPVRPDVTVDVSKSTTRFPGAPMTFRIVDGPPSAFSNGKLVFKAPHGDRPVRIVAEDAAGRRSFPRSVFISSPELNHHAVPLYTVFSEDTRIQPGVTATLPLGAYVIDLPAIGFDLTFIARQRLSGLGEDRPDIAASGLVFSPALQAVGATQNVTPLPGGLGLSIRIRWDAAKALTGRIDLGVMQIRVPATTALGSTFILRGAGAVAIGPAANPTLQPVNVLPALVNVWGGVEPPALSIDGPVAVFENASIELRVSGPGLVPNAPNIGWWTEKISGQAGVQQNWADRNAATLKGVRAGYVRVKAVAGTRTAEKIVKVQAAVRPRLFGIGRLPLKLLPMTR